MTLPLRLTAALLALALALALAALAAAAWAQTEEYGSAPTAIVSVKSNGASGNTLSLSCATMTAASAALSCSTAAFTAADVGKSIAVTGAGAASVTLTTTIAAVADAHDVTLAAAAATSIAPANSVLTAAAVATAQSGSGSYAPGDTVTAAGGTASTAAVLTVATTTLVSATVNNAGSGGTNGTCYLTGTTGAGTTLFTVNATISGGVISAINSVLVGGFYTTNPTSLTAEPVTGVTEPGGSTACIAGAPTLALKMGIFTAYPSTPGVYSATATTLTQSATSGSGTGATFTASWVRQGVATYGTDDSGAFAAAINAVNALTAAGTRALLYMPAGLYYLCGTPLPAFTGVASLKGDATNGSDLYVCPAYATDIFAWSNAALTGNFPLGGVTADMSVTMAGINIRDITIWGDRTAGTDINAFAFYDATDFVFMENVNVFYLKGRALYAGALKNQSNGYIRESNFEALRFWYDGDANYPVVEITSAGTAPSSNETTFDSLQIYANYGTGVLLHNPNSSQSMYDLFFRRLRIEGLANNPGNVKADLFQIGDGTATGTIRSVFLTDTAFLNDYAQYAALHLTAPSNANVPFDNYVVDGHINSAYASGGAGQGLRVDYGKDSTFAFREMITPDTNVVLGTHTHVVGQIVLDGYGYESGLGWTYAFGDTTVSQVLLNRGGLHGNVENGTPNFQANYHDGSVQGGNAPGNNAVDLQMLRTAVTQVASGAQSALLGGGTNTVSGTYCTVAAGFNNQCLGSYSGILGGRQASDHTRYGSQAWASGQFSTGGDAQDAKVVLRGSGASHTAFALTADASAAGANNCFDIGNAYSLGFTVTLEATDTTTRGTDYSWFLPAGLLTRDANAASTAISLGTPVIVSRGTITGAAVALTADTTNGCMTLTFAPPTGDSDTWHAVAVVRGTEVH